MCDLCRQIDEYVQELEETADVPVALSRLRTIRAHIRANDGADSQMHVDMLIASALLEVELIEPYQLA